MLAANFLLNKASGSEVLFAESFRQRWVGLGIDADGATDPGAVFDAAIATWQTALGLESSVEVDLVVRNFGNSQLGSGTILEVGADGVTTRGRIVIDDDANGLGWFSDLDATPEAGQYDLYTVLLHELGHVFGFTPAHSGFASNLDTYADVLDADGLHILESSNPGDLMNRSLNTGERRTPSALNVEILQAAYIAGSTVSGGQAAPLHGNQGDATSVYAIADQLPRYDAPVVQSIAITPSAEARIASAWDMAAASLTDDDQAERLFTTTETQAVAREVAAPTHDGPSFGEQAMLWLEADAEKHADASEATDTEADYLESLEGIFAEMGDK
jgi:hypothetical protein